MENTALVTYGHLKLVKEATGKQPESVVFAGGASKANFGAKFYRIHWEFSSCANGKRSNSIRLQHTCRIWRWLISGHFANQQKAC